VKLESLNRLKWLAAGMFLLILTVMGIVVVREWDALIAFPWQIDVRYLGLTVTFHSLALGVTFWVWHLMITRFGHFDNAKLNFRFYYLSTLAKRIPTAIWYVGGRLTLYRQVGVAASTVLNCILLENVVIGIAGVLTFLVFLPLYSQFLKTGVISLALVGIVGITGLLVRPQLFVDITNWILKRLGKQILDIAPARKDIIVWGGLYILPWVLAGFSLYCAIRAFSGDVGLSIIDAVGISTLVMLVALLSTILPSGLGLKELTSSVLLSHWMPLSSAVVISIAYRLIQTANEMLWALAAAIFFASPEQ